MSPTQQESGNLSAKDKICFRGSNFNVYKTRIQAKLKAAGLWTTVLGHEDDDDEAEEKANKAFNVIIKPLDDDNVAYVCHLKLVSDVWALLTERYESRAYADVSHVIHCMHTTSYKPGTSMQRHLTELRGFQQKLMHMGSMVEDEMLGKVVLTSVKDAFPTTVEILRSLDVTGNKLLFSKLRSNNAVSLNLADNTQVKAKRSGQIKIPLEDGGLLLRPNVMFAPGFCKNLLALRVLLKEGYIVACWNAEKAILVNLTTDSKLHFGLRNGLSMLETSPLKPLPVEEANVITARQPIPKLVQWHRRFAHLNFGALKQAIANGVIIRPSLSDSDLKETDSVQLDVIDPSDLEPDSMDISGDPGQDTNLPGGDIASTDHDESSTWHHPAVALSDPVHDSTPATTAFDPNETHEPVDRPEQDDDTDMFMSGHTNEPDLIDALDPQGLEAISINSV
ncbi:hypothetical protein DYB30_013203 [Aphanomyces astaci]|uniref:Retrovirus-related Pol polyprotein from transposon TNT 1-94-like beta-barrel domain-containing protein n=2 Tax=Aphanomyces astaci TaxID=112090 RepID=A0A397DD23_APHAT|nr:hypothetical protein DYB30_013203 [Aphanomyces astaci]RHY86404.1 hypothetical protein DYB26_013045 [Aphanomyces astaci]